MDLGQSAEFLDVYRFSATDQRFLRPLFPANRTTSGVPPAPGLFLHFGHCRATGCLSQERLRCLPDLRSGSALLVDYANSTVVPESGVSVHSMLRTAKRVRDEGNGSCLGRLRYVQSETR